jgi:hypothetical protein
MHQYRQILARMRMGDTDRSISRAGLMGRKKAGQVREEAVAQGWLNIETPLPEEAVLAAAFTRKAEEPTQGSLVLPYAQDIQRWHQQGVQGTTIHEALVLK